MTARLVAVCVACALLAAPAHAGIGDRLHPAELLFGMACCFLSCLAFPFVAVLLLGRLIDRRNTKSRSENRP